MINKKLMAVSDWLNKLHDNYIYDADLNKVVISHSEADMKVIKKLLQNITDVDAALTTRYITHGGNKNMKTALNIPMKSDIQPDEKWFIGQSEIIDRLKPGKKIRNIIDPKVPKFNKIYYYIQDGVVKDAIWLGYTIDRIRMDAGNVYLDYQAAKRSILRSLTSTNNL